MIIETLKINGQNFSKTTSIIIIIIRLYCIIHHENCHFMELETCSLMYRDVWYRTVPKIFNINGEVHAAFKNQEHI